MAEETHSPMAEETHIEINPRLSIENQQQEQEKTVPFPFFKPRLSIENPQAEEKTVPFPFFKPLTHRKENTWVISVFVILHLIAFAVTMIVNDCWGNSNGQCVMKQLGRFSFQPLNENPFLGPSNSGLDSVGALRLRYLASDHQLWRIFTSLCLHAGVFHLIINLSGVIFIGIHLEQEFGPIRIGVIYILSALSGSLLATLFLQDQPTVTSSGALFGLLGATLAALIRNWKAYSKKLATLVTFFTILILNSILGLMPIVNNFSNVGGFISGFLAGFTLLFAPQVSTAFHTKGGIFDYDLKLKPTLKLKQKLDKPVLRTVSLVILSLLLAGVSVPVLQGIHLSKYCSWCNIIDCVPINWWSCNGNMMSCETMTSLEQMTLTCSDSGKFGVFPFANVSQARLEDLCYLICS